MSDGEARIADVLERSACFFEDFLWGSEVGASAVAWLAARGLKPGTLREFQIGYAPGGGQLLGHLQGERHAPTDLEAAGVALRSKRGRLHARFSSRIVFPVKDREGEVNGFAGLATHSGPSWPEWVNTPESERYRRSLALFGIDRAGAVIAAQRRALIVDDCVEVLRLHQRGERDAVAPVRAQISDGHVLALAQLIGATPDQLESSSQALPNPGVRAVRLRLRAAAPLADPGATGDAERRLVSFSPGPGQPSSAPEPSSRAPYVGGVRPEPLKVRSLPTLAFLQAARGTVGIGIPLAWLAIVGVDLNAPGGSGTAFVGSVAGVAGTYLLLALLVALVSGRIRDRSRSRRMRAPWERGASEWQPPAWTYHLFEDVAIGASVLSVVVCLVLFIAIGGFIKT